MNTFPPDKKQSLKECAEYLCEYVHDNFNVSSIDLEAPDEVQQAQVVSYIDQLSRGMIHSFLRWLHGIIWSHRRFNDSERIQ